MEWCPSIFILRIHICFLLDQELGHLEMTSMSYETQLDWINKMFAGAGVTSLKKTHAGRSQGAKHAELNGVNEG